MAWEGSGKEIMTSLGIARKWEGKKDLCWWGKEIGRKNNICRGVGRKMKEKWHEMSKTNSKPYEKHKKKNGQNARKYKKNTKRMGNFATYQDTKIKGKYQMPMGKEKRKIPKTKRKRKRKREMPKSKGKREKEKGKTKIKRKKEKGKGNIKHKREGKGREIYLFLPNFTGKRNSR